MNSNFKHFYVLDCDNDYSVATCPSFSTSITGLTSSSSISAITDSTPISSSSTENTESSSSSSTGITLPENSCDDPLPFTCPDIGTYPIVVSTCCNKYYICTDAGDLGVQTVTIE